MAKQSRARMPLYLVFGGICLGLLGYFVIRANAKEAEYPYVAQLVANGRKLYSQGNEELIFRGFFQDRREGFFLDVGCGPSQVISTTYYLEKRLDWSGVGVDALPEYAEEYKRERPRTQFLNFIVTDVSGTQKPFYRVKSARGKSSTSKDYAEQSGAYTILEVPTITLNDLLEENHVETIDLMSMDIEDAEPAALAGFDIKKYSPALVCIEAHEAVAAQIAEYFARHDYERIDEFLKYDHVNWYFKPRE